MLGGVNIDTAQNVTINYELASLGDRIVAYIIDLVIKIGYAIFAAMLFFPSFSFDEGMIALGIILWMPIFLYPLISELMMNGQSIGKRARNIKVVKLDGSAPGFFNYFLRWILFPIDNVYGLGLLVLLINGKGQRLGDLAAATTVVKVQLRTTLEDTIFKPVEDNYTPTYPEVTRLTDEHIRLVNDVLRYHESIATADTALLATTSAKVKNIMHIELKNNTPMSDLGFLYTVVKDYNYYTQRTK